MGYWGWRPLLAVVFISVWIVGCTSTSNLTPETDTTELPEATAMNHPPPRTQTTLPHFLPLTLTLAPQQTEATVVEIRHTINAVQNEVLIELSRILCYETVTNRIICYGQMHNQSDLPLHQVHFENENENLVDESPTSSQNIVLYQHVLLPDENAPFHFWLDDISTANQAPIVTVHAPVFEQRYTSLRIEELRTEHSSQAFRLYAQITNDFNDSLDWVQAVMTVFDDEDQVVGYRIANLGGFQPDESRLLDLTIVPHNDVHHHTLRVIGGINVP